MPLLKTKVDFPWTNSTSNDVLSSMLTRNPADLRWIGLGWSFLESSCIHGSQVQHFPALLPPGHRRGHRGRGHGGRSLDLRSDHHLRGQAGDRDHWSSRGGGRRGGKRT